MTQPMMTLAQAATALQGQTSAPDVSFDRVNTDSRAVEPGDLFIALKGERFDAHDFVKQALADGAAAALVNQGYQGEPGQPLIRVADTHAALGQLAAFWRQQFSLPVAGITGSNGKTSVKEMVAAILNAAVGEDQVLATRGNLNNDIGMPLTLLRLRAQHRYVVLEMGMNHLGEIAYLSRLAQPNVTVINNAQAAHLEGLGDVATVARAKGEIFEGLPADGIAVINADDAHAAMWRQLAGERKRIEFGLQTGDVCCDFTLGVYGSELTLAHTDRLGATEPAGAGAAQCAQRAGGYGG
jgi:UDP-N-acetylmuramoyl-tripeptide--D-alanyl-D-alanine ligase